MLFLLSAEFGNELNKVFKIIRTLLDQAIKLFTRTDNQNLTFNWIVRFVIWYYLVYGSCDSFWRIVQWNGKQVTKDLKQSATRDIHFKMWRRLLSKKSQTVQPQREYLFMHRKKSSYLQLRRYWNWALTKVQGSQTEASV